MAAARHDERWSPAYAPPSKVSGVEWPVLPDGQIRAGTALFEQMLETQWWPPEALRAQQLRQAARLVAHARRTVPFYRRRHAGLAPASEAALPWEQFAGLPILTKDEIRAAGAGILSEAVPPDHRPVGQVTTSGTTGVVLACRATALSEWMFEACRAREWLWHRRDPAAKMAVIRRHADPATRGETRTAADTGILAALFRTGERVNLDIFDGADANLDALAREAPVYLTTLPSALRTLLRAARRRRVRLPGLRQVLTMGEPVSDDLRADCAEQWGVGIADRYGCAESGYLAAQCPESGDYHVASEAVLLEVLDERGRPCRPGETGQVVVTQLHNFAMPLVRYALADLAELGGPCRCGRGLPVLRRILGRERNRLTLPTGEHRFGLVVRAAIETVAAVRQCQLVQSARDRIEVRMVVDRKLTPAEEDRIRAGVAGQVRFPIGIALVYLDSFPPAAHGKFEEFKSEIGG